MATKPLRIRAATLFDGKSQSSDKIIDIEGDTIVSVKSNQKGKVDFEGIVTPAFIDAHSHIGMFREGEPGSEQEGNDHLDQVLPLSDPINGVYFDDRAFRDAIEFGVLYSCIIPGSGNLVGGRAKIIKHFAAHRGEALLKDYGYKMALGFNPRSTTDWRGERPNTRMGVYGLLERRFDDVIAKAKRADISNERKLLEVSRKLEKKEMSSSEADAERSRIHTEETLDLTPHERALLEIATGKRIVKVHVHKEDDVVYLIDLVKRYGMRVTAEHTGDVHHKEIFNLLAAAKIPIVFGPLGSFAYKVELSHAYYQNAKLLMDSRATFGLMTDHPVIHVTALRDSLKFFLINGMTHEDAIGLITYQNAKILEIDDQIGTVAQGRKASVLVWKEDPLHLAAIPRTVIAEGNVLVKRRG